MIEIRNLTKTFETGGQATTVLNDISFTVSPGEFVAVMGQSGSGKSTLLYTASGMDQLTSGHVLIDGTNLADQDEAELADLRLHKMGFVFQHNYLLKNLTIRDNICLPAFQAKRLGRPEVAAKADGLLERMMIEDIADKPIQQVSGGQLQRAAICRALINDPVILFADEPTGALNSRASAEVIGIFNALNRDGATIMMVTHDPRIASRTDRIVYLSDGRVVDEYRPGRFDPDADDHDRVERTLDWLVSKGF